MVILSFWAVSMAIAQEKIVVPDDVPTLEMACERVEDGGTILLHSRTYLLLKPLVLEKNITIAALEGENVKITTCKEGVFWIKADNVHLKNLSLQSTKCLYTGDVLPEKYKKIWYQGYNEDMAELKHFLVQTKEITNEEEKESKEDYDEKEFQKVFDEYSSQFDVRTCTLYITGHNAIIEHCDISGNSDACIVSGEENHSRFLNCYFHDSDGGIWICQKAEPTVRFCNFNRNRSGICIDVDCNFVPVIENCKFSYNLIGIDSNRGNSAQISECEIDSNVCGIFVYNTANSNFKDCKIMNCSDSGVDIMDTASPFFQECEILNNLDTGMYITDQANPNLNLCTIHNNQGNGIYIDSNVSGIFEHCDIYGNELLNVAVDEHGNPRFNQCSIYKSKGNGIIVGGYASGIFERCDIYGNELLNVAVDEHGNPTFQDCMIHSAKVGVLLLNGAGTFTKCDIYNNTDKGICIDDGNASVESCRIHHCNYGAVFYGAYTGSFRKCDIAYNTKAGIDYQTEKKIPVKGCHFTGNTQNKVHNPPSAHTAYHSKPAYRSRPRGNGRGIAGGIAALLALIGSLFGCSSQEQNTKLKPGTKVYDMKINSRFVEIIYLYNTNTNTCTRRILDRFKQHTKKIWIDGCPGKITHNDADIIINRARGTYPDNKLPGPVEFKTIEGNFIYE